MLKFIFLLFLSVGLGKDPALPEHTLPVYGNASLGYYFVELFVGHPPQQQSVIIDTGSGQLALPCNKCTSCNPKHIDKPFDMSKSKTAEYLTCESSDPQCKRCSSKNPTQSCKFTISYAEGSSLQGIIVKDSIQFQSFSQGQEIVTSFGCTTRQTNLFLKQQANGIFGLAPQRTSNLLQDLYEKHHGFSGEQLEFSLCLSKNGGLMSIGKINEALHITKNSVKTTFSDQRNLYTLNGVKNIRIGNSVIHKEEDRLGVYGLFIDSGSTFTYFPRENYLIFKKELVERCAANKDLCDEASGESVLCFHMKGNENLIRTTQEVFPPIILEINDQKISWKPTKYFLLRDRGNREICLGIEALDRYLLGANWMVDRDIVFNLKEKTVEIFTEANCENKPRQEWDMGQFTNQADGHQPLGYQESITEIVTSKVKNVQFTIVIGIVLVFVGLVGLLLILMNKRQNDQSRPLSSIQTQDHIQSGQIGSQSQR